jgi:acyl-CoA synthetase (AMP-forming)/AMP-acid ligase II
VGGGVVGVAVTPINPSYTVDEVAYQLRDAGAQVLFTLAELLPVATAAAAGTRVRGRGMRQGRGGKTHVRRLQVRQLYCLGAEGTAAAPPLHTLYCQAAPTPLHTRPVLDPARDTAVICYSSGTTGTWHLNLEEAPADVTTWSVWLYAYGHGCGYQGGPRG